MVFFGWSPEYSVHVEELDEQHKKLLGLMNEAYSAIQEKMDHINISMLLTEMSDYAISHFSKEEHLLKKFNYKDFETQKREHDLFFDQVAKFKVKLAEGDPLIVDKISEYLSVWLFNHILENDQKYSDFLNENGIT